MLSTSSIDGTIHHLLPSTVNNMSANASSVGSMTSSVSSLATPDLRQPDASSYLPMPTSLSMDGQQTMFVDPSHTQGNGQAGIGNGMQLDVDSFDQASLHRHFTAMSAQQQSAPFEQAPASALSFAPPPDLVQSALQQAALKPGRESEPVSPG